MSVIHYGPSHFYEERRQQEIREETLTKKFGRGVILKTRKKQAARDRYSIQKPWKAKGFPVANVIQDPPECLKQYLPLNRRFTLKEVMEATAIAANCGVNDILKKSRLKHHCFARHVFIWLGYELTDHSLSEVADYCAGRDRTTAINSYRVVYNCPLAFEEIVSLACAELKELRA